MHLPKFDLKQPASVAEAQELLRHYGSSAKLAAGGTDLFPRMKYRLTEAEVVVSLARLHAAKPTAGSEGNVRLDAFMKLADIGRSQVIRHTAPLLVEAALWVGSSQIRHMATLGGNVCLESRCMFFNQGHDFQFVEPCFKRGGDHCYLLPKGRKCWALCTADTAPALVCLGAQAALIGSEGTREEAVEDLFSGDSVRPLRLGPTDIVVRISIPTSSAPRGWAFMKLCPRGGLEFATVNIAVILEMLEDRETCSSAGIVVGAVAASPVRAAKAEQLLRGQKLSNDLFKAVAQTAAQEIRPAPRPSYSRSYVKKCVETLCRDSLEVATERIGADGSTLPA